ncbi:MAG: SPOR domain-containing protein [Candidatus Omnitrophica bacterium]|nr:SPOR domain-containing protein [Candidatus Omnitrophota bacterium]
MNINYKQPQFELFPGNSGHESEAVRPRLFLANLTLTIENLVVLSILGIMLAVFAYSLGVERGKHVMAAQMVERTPVKPLISEAPVVIQPAPLAVAKFDSAVVTPPAVTTVAQPVNRPVEANAETKSQVSNPDFKYTVQVASYADEKFAKKVAEELDKKGFQTMVIQKGKYVILCVGKFNQKNEAKATIAKLKSKYKDCLVRSM